MSKKWQDIAQEKRQAVNSILPEKWKTTKPIPPVSELPDVTNYAASFLSEKEREITAQYTARELVGKLARKEYTAVQVVEAFCHRATIAHELVNCISEVLFSQALTRAAELDDYLRAHGKPIGPLHGLPISLKDQFRVKDAETSLGYVAWLGKKETDETESFLVKRLKELGAIVYVKTNVPTSLMAIETNNNIIGYTLNPYNRLLSSGGSSGGEASLLALRGSIIGLGSDIGASIRLPSAVSGLTGLKPSHGRLPYLGVANSMEGQETVPSVIGPLAHNVADLRFLFKSICQTQPWHDDPKVLPLPWRADEEEKGRDSIKEGGLTFGVIKWDGVVMPHPPVQRAIQETISKLKAQGHEVIEWSPPAHQEAFEILWNTFAADGGTDIHATLSLSGEAPVPQLSASFGEVAGTLPVPTINDIWALQRRKYEYQTRYLAYWNSTATLTKPGRPVDALIAPAAPTASFLPGNGLYFGYTGVFNVLDFSVVVVPVTKVDKTRDPKVEGYVPAGDLDTLVWQQYDPEIFHGVPIGLQIVGRRLEEERILAISEEVERCLSKQEVSK